MILHEQKYRRFLQWGFAVLLGFVLLVFASWVNHSPEHRPENREIFGSTLHLRLSAKDRYRLRLKRDQALEKQILFAEDEDWVRGELVTAAGTQPVKLRLKGDWTDHLEGEKWSFRVKCLEGTAWKGMRVFSLMNPASRNFLHEWLFHEMLREHDLLTPRYDFVRLKVNGADMGVYALEEHFSKEMLEAQGRREGPILKLDESGLWEVRDREFSTGDTLTNAFPVFESAYSTPFQPAKQLRTDSSAQVLHNGLTSLEQFKFGLRSYEALFDLEQMATRLAIIDFFGAHHSLYWSNTRYYYNPVSAKLEPVTFDGFGEPDPAPQIEHPFLGYATNSSTTYGDPAEGLGTRFWAFETFCSRYYSLLHRWSIPGFSSDTPDIPWFEHWLGKRADEIEERERFLRQEYLAYRFKTDFFEEWQAESRDYLESQEVAALDSLKREKLENGLWFMQNRSPFPILIRDENGQQFFLEAFDGQRVPFSDTIQLDDQYFWGVSGSLLVKQNGYSCRECD